MLSILLTILFMIIVYCAIKIQQGIRKYDRYPGEPMLPILGHTWDYMNIGAVETFNKLRDSYLKHGDRYKLLLGPFGWIVVSSPVMIETFLTNPKFFSKSNDYDIMATWLGKGLLLTNGTKWFSHRKALTPAFHFKILENFIPIFDEQSQILIDQLSKKGENGLKAIDIFPTIKLYTLDVICETAMGTQIHAQTNSTIYTVGVEEISAIIYWRMFTAYAIPETGFWLSRKYKRFQELVEILHKFTISVIENRRQELENSGELGDQVEMTEDVYGIRKKMALLDILLRAKIDGKPLENEEIREEVDNFMFAGHDTTASAVTFLLFNLAKHQDVQEKVLNEVRDVIGDSTITLHALNNLKYLDLVIKESIRIFPPVPYIGRQVHEDVEVDGDIIPAGSNLSLSIYNMHHNPEFFPEPEKFIPERFDAAKENDKVHNFCYIPFSAGSRNCIGQKFAMYEIKTVISQIVRNFHIRLVDEGYEPILKGEIVLKPAEDLPLIFYPRTENIN